MTVVRGFIPAGLRSSPKIIQRGHLEKPCPPLLRLLRSRTGINPLTTGIHSRFFMAVPLAGWSGAADPIVAWNITVVRGFIPAGLRSSPETIQRGDSVRSGKQDLRLLRSRTGMNPLTTGIHSRFFMAAPLAGWSGAADPIVAWNMTVVRGFIPAGLRSSPKTIQRGHLEKPCPPLLRLLRSRTGINPLTTGDSFQIFYGRAFGWMVWRG